MTVEPFLVLANLDKEYRDHHAVKSIDLDVGTGEFVALMGPSGCGKSTTLRLIAGLEEPTAGEVRIAGRRMNDVPPAERNTPMVWQSLALFPFLSTVENVEFGLRMRGIGPRTRRERAAEWLDRLDLGGLAHRRIDQLSGGQRQRVAIARALVTQPPILLLDEPLSSLDAHLRVRMQTELTRLQKELGITFIYVTHAQSEAFAMANRVVIMNQGEIQQIGNPREIYRAPQNAFVAEFIGMNNLVAGVVAGNGEGWTEVATGFGTFRAASPHPAVAGARAQYVLAADRISLAPANGHDAAPGTCTGTVVGEEFVGSVVTLFVEIDGGPEFKIQKQQREIESLGVRPGQRLQLFWRPDDAFVLLN